jgi:type IV secretory pathway VirJ component
VKLKFVLVTVFGLLASGLPAAAAESIPVQIRGKTLTLAYYQPAAGTARKGTVMIGSGDVGWVGLGVEVAEFLSRDGYGVAGINVREYLSAFTTRSSHVTTEQVPADYQAMAKALQDRGLLVQPVILSGVSEGAALAVLAASARENHAWVKCVITMGLPVTAELAWRWTDFTAWITKHDAAEPSFDARQFVPGVAPVPLFMIQSVRDEYVTEADYRTFERLANNPKRLVLIPASNHRFTDKKPELKTQILAGLEWMKSPS